jgi:hypothetical protein
MWCEIKKERSEDQCTYMNIHGNKTPFTIEKLLIKCMGKTSRIYTLYLKKYWNSEKINISQNTC